MAHPEELPLIFKFADDDDDEEEEQDPHAERWADYKVAKEAWLWEEAEREQRIWDCTPAPAAAAADEWPG